MTQMGDVAEVSGGAAIVIMVVYAIVIIFSIVVNWKILSKAAQPGWSQFIPIYNAICFSKACGKPGWYWLLLLIPIANIVFAILMVAGLAKCFGKGAGFVIGLLLLGPIFGAILAFGSAEWSEPEAA